MHLPPHTPTPTRLPAFAVSWPHCAQGPPADLFTLFPQPALPLKSGPLFQLETLLRTKIRGCTISLQFKMPPRCPPTPLPPCKMSS